MSTKPTFLRLDLPETSQRMWGHQQVAKNSFAQCKYCDALYVYRESPGALMPGSYIPCTASQFGEAKTLLVAGVDTLQCRCGARIELRGSSIQVLGAVLVPRPKPAPKPLTVWQRFWNWVWGA